MHPILFKIGSFTIHTYGVLVAAGVLLGLILARRQAKRSGLDPERVWSLGIYLVLAAVVGSKLWLFAFHWDYFWQNPRDIFSLSTLQSAGVFYGGLLAAVLLAFLYARRQRMPFLAVADVFSAPLALGHSIGRLGCFAAGCCWGKPTDSFLGVRFTNEYSGQLVGVPLGIPIHPTQLYEAAATFAIFLILIRLGRRQRFSGEIFAWYAILYGVARGLLEFLRGDPDRSMFAAGAFSVMQVVSLGLILIGLWLFWSHRRRTATA